VLVSWDLAPWRKPGADQAAASKLALFEEVVLPHLNAAHNLARWLMGNAPDAQDAVQEAYLRAFRYFAGYQGGDSKAWLLEIVRNTCRTWLSRRSRGEPHEPFDEMSHTGDRLTPDPEQALAGRERMGILRRCIENLPAEFREVLVLRELEEMPYREIASVTGLAIGTVMSRLSRARQRLADCAAKSNLEVAP